MMKDSNEGRLVIYLLTKTLAQFVVRLVCCRRGKSVMIQDRSDTIAIRAGTEEGRGRACLFSCSCNFFFCCSHSCMHAISHKMNEYQSRRAGG